jgi:hypothetical protein
MSSVDPPTHIPEWAVQRMRELHRDLGASQIVQQLHEQVLTDTERRSLPRDDATRDGILNLWQLRWAVPLEQAVLDLASRAHLLASGELQSLQEALNITAPGTASNLELPSWDDDRAELWFRGEVIRRIARPTDSTNVILLIRAFQEENWGRRIHDPLPGVRDPERLRQTIRSLNARLTAIRFLADGTGNGVLWEVL